MMPGSIRLRLTAWYALSVTVILGLFAVGAWLAMRESVVETVDHDLRTRIEDVREFVLRESSSGRAELEHEFREQTLLGLGGGLVQVTDAAGRILYRSAGLRAGQLPAIGPSGQISSAQYYTEGKGKSQVRVASQIIVAQGDAFMVQVAEPLREFHESTERFQRTLFILGPLFLALATVGGFWISGRALSPVDRITTDARRINIANLSSRLGEPAANDELKRLTQTLNEMLDRIDTAVKRIIQFTADASHELRAPLTLIQTAAEFSLRRDRSRDELLDAMRKIARESDRTSRLVDDLLLLARADSGNDEFQLGATDFAASVRSAAERAFMLAQAKAISVSSDIPVAPISVNADEEALARLWLILLDNAVKYTPEGGRIHFLVQVLAGHAEFVISDTGVGIAPEDLAHVFDRFWRADKVRSRAVGGAGLGLSIARWIVERHSGEIVLHSEVGRGSEVIVRLPLSSHDPGDDHRPEAAAHTARRA